MHKTQNDNKTNSVLAGTAHNGCSITPLHRHRNWLVTGMATGWNWYVVGRN